MAARREQPIAGATALGWLRERLLPRGEASLMLAAYAMLAVALGTFVAFQRDLPPGSYVAGIAILVALLVLNMLLPDVEAALGDRRGAWLHLILSGGLWLAVTRLVLGSDSFSFVPFLLFMLVAQAVVALPRSGAIGYGVALLAGFAGALWSVGMTAGAVTMNLLSTSTGLVFVVVFSTVLNLARAQQARAEALAVELTAANAALEAARQRERELAAVEERVRLAREIHDGLGHHLTVLSVQLQAAARLVERDPARAAAALATSREVAQAALDEVRQSVAAMRHSPLDGRSLPEALAALVADFARRAELHAGFEARGEAVELGPAATQTLYRAAQEGLTNAHKHGRAGTIGVALEYGPHGVALAVEDDGVGAPATHGSGFGLTGLRERAAQLGGTLRAGPRAEGGYGLRLEIPLVGDEEGP